MSQNMFGQPAQAEPEEVAPEAAPGSSRKKLLVGGAATLAAVALLGAGAFVLTSGGDDDVSAASAPAAAPVPAAAEPTEAPAPLPTLAQFNGRNPFKAKVVEGGGAGAGAGATASGSEAVPGSTTTPGGVTVGPDGKVISLPGKDGVPGQNGKDGQDGRDGQDGQDGQDGRDGTDASALYAVLVGVVPDAASGDTTVEIALGVGSDFEIHRVTAPKPSDTTFPQLASWAPAKWTTLLSAVDVPDQPDAEFKDVGDSATIQFGDRKLSLTWMKAVPLL